MGLFSGLFGGGKKGSGVHSGKNPPNKGWVTANRFNKARGGHTGGWAAIAFGNIVNAHSSAEEVAIQFELYSDQNPYTEEPYNRAYREVFEEIAYPAYEDLVGFYMELIDLNESEIIEREAEIEELEQRNEEIREEIEELRDELEDVMADGFDPDDLAEVEEIREEIEELEQELEENLERIEELHNEIINLQQEIDGYYSEIDFLNPEDFMDETELEDRALKYATDYAQQWVDGDIWIPSEVLDWAFYDVSDHNR